MPKKANDQAIVEALLKAKAIDFNAIAKVFAEFGPSLARTESDDLRMGGVQRGFVQLMKLHPSSLSLESLEELRAALEKTKPKGE